MKASQTANVIFWLLAHFVDSLNGSFLCPNAAALSWGAVTFVDSWSRGQCPEKAGFLSISFYIFVPQSLSQSFSWASWIWPCLTLLCLVTHETTQISLSLLERLLVDRCQGAQPNEEQANEGISTISMARIITKPKTSRKPLGPRTTTNHQGKKHIHILTPNDHST